jgi:hypothetical protein
MSSPEARAYRTTRDLAGAVAQYYPSKSAAKGIVPTFGGFDLSRIPLPYDASDAGMWDAILNALETASDGALDDLLTTLEVRHPTDQRLRTAIADFRVAHNIPANAVVPATDDRPVSVTASVPAAGESPPVGNPSLLGAVLVASLVLVGGAGASFAMNHATKWESWLALFLLALLSGFTEHRRREHPLQAGLAIFLAVGVLVALVLRLTDDSSDDPNRGSQSTSTTSLVESSSDGK